MQLLRSSSPTESQLHITKTHEDKTEAVFLIIYKYYIKTSAKMCSFGKRHGKLVFRCQLQLVFYSEALNLTNWKLNTVFLSSASLLFAASYRLPPT